MNGLRYLISDVTIYLPQAGTPTDADIPTTPPFCFSTPSFPYLPPTIWNRHYMTVASHNVTIPTYPHNPLPILLLLRVSRAFLTPYLWDLIPQHTWLLPHSPS